jgi:hypothetical protein
MLARLNLPLKLLLGVATLWPLLYLIVFFVWFVSIFLSVVLLPDQGATADAGFPGAFGLFIVLHLGTILWSFLLTALYIVDLFKTDRVDQDKKALWAVVLFLGGMVALPVYWYLYVWRPPTRASS